MDVLKLFPLRGWQIVAGELLAPAVILTLAQWGLLIILAVLVRAAAGQTIPVQTIPIEWFVAVALLMPMWNALALLIPNASVLLFPGWFQTRVDAPQGIEVTGQRLLLFFGQMIAIGVTIVPAAAVFGFVFWLLYATGAGAIAPITGALGAALVLAGEIALGTWLVGKLFDRFDIAAEQGG
jgi:hypothetical protein